VACAICDLPITKDEMEFEIQFARDGDNPGLDRFQRARSRYRGWSEQAAPLTADTLDRCLDASPAFKPTRSRISVVIGLRACSSPSTSRQAYDEDQTRRQRKDHVIREGCAESRRAIFVPFAECLGEQGHGAPQHRRHGTSILPALTAE
jgi:hypothetical protein